MTNYAAHHTGGLQRACCGDSEGISGCWNHICQSLQEKYAYGNKKYQIVVPKGVADILAEGKILCHCVARNQNDVYWDRISRHETYLLSCERRTAPHVPYYTLEVEPDGTDQAEADQV